MTNSNEENIEEIFTCANGEKVRLVVDQDATTIKVTTLPDDQAIGSIEFDCTDEGTKLIWAHLEGQNGRLRRQGIGRKCLQMADELWGPIWAEIHDGIARDDGSHLTGDAPAFVNKMRKENLIAKTSDDADEDDAMERE